MPALTPQHVACENIPRPAIKAATATDALARKAVFQKLSALSESRLQWRDAWGDASFGSTGEVSSCVDVADPRLYRRVVRGGSLALAEAYIDGWWSTNDLLTTLTSLASLPEAAGANRGAGILTKLVRQAWRLAHRNTRRGSAANIHAHYDLSNEFFAAFLDPSMTYSSGLFESPESTLADASAAKYERICRLLELSPRDRVVEIGCGWGGFAEYAARNFGCHVTGVTISREQLDYARRRMEQAGLAERVTLEYCDYRDLTGRFDKLASIEMIEAVGHEYLAGFFATCSGLLKPAGKMALQAITIPDQRYGAYRRNVDFIQRYIFPGGCLPSLGAIQGAVGRATDLRLVECVDFAEDYARTLVEWRERFHAARNKIMALGFDERFLRMWDYYLCYCAAGFRRRRVGLAQIAFAKPECR